MRNDKFPHISLFLDSRKAHFANYRHKMLKKNDEHGLETHVHIYLTPFHIFKRAFGNLFRKLKSP